MTTDKALDLLAGHHGILDSFIDLSGQERRTNPDTKKALLRANGVELTNDAMIHETLAAFEAEKADRRFPGEVVVQVGAPLALDLGHDTSWRLDLETGTAVAVEGRGQMGLPLSAGVHVLTVQSGARCEQITLIATPTAAPSVGALTGRDRLWGVNGALYGLRSARNLGLGDYQDLARAAKAAAAQGAGYFGVNPIHALGWSDTETISPYSPSHRGFLNSLHIAVDHIPGLESSGRAQSLLASRQVECAAARRADLIDYAGYRIQMAPLLEDLFDVFRAEASTKARQSFASYCQDRRRALSDFTLFEALSEKHGPDWRKWPSDLRSATHPGVPTARTDLAHRMQFHAWLQWLCAAQVSDAQVSAKQAGMPLGLYLDLAVGPRRGGAETWCEGDSIAQGVSIGAPSDQLNPAGQNWDLAAYAPGKQARGRYGAFRQVLRETMRHAGILRIDHILGMNRSFWIPDDGSPGAYIRQPFHSLLAIIAIEANRARTAVIGEDLGLVPQGFREAINARGLYSYSVLQYEKDGAGAFRAPDAMRPQSLACFGTHDTPTLNGFRAGRDIDWWQNLGWIDEDEARMARSERLGEVAALGALGGCPAQGEADTDLATRVHTTLAKSPVAMVSVQLDDLDGQVEAQNLPGTINEHPNWRRRSTVPLEQFDTWPELMEIGQIMQNSERGQRPADLKEKTDEA